MSGPGSVTLWIAQLKAGERDAVQPLWQNYCRRLTARARRRLAGVPRRAADEEDVALSAFDSFCRAAEQARFPQLHDRDDLWQLLLVITDRKACDLANHETRDRRGGGRVVDETALTQGSESPEDAPLDQVQSPEPSPAFAALAAEEFRRLLGVLGDDDLRQVAVRKMEGYTVAEIAAQLGRVPRTVKRWLRLIQQTWQQELPP
jgi:DNA-directed RNA polymerase specialized sigma24 family protein